MKRNKLLLILLLTIFTTACESYLIHGDLDGLWQVTSIENKQTGNITKCNGNIYYSFQRDLVLISYVLPEKPTGQMKENHIAYFSHENDSIAMTDFRIYLDRNGKQSPLSKLSKFGLYDIYNTFGVEKLNKNTLILNSEKARIILTKH